MKKRVIIIVIFLLLILIIEFMLLSKIIKNLDKNNIVTNSTTNKMKLENNEKNNTNVSNNKVTNTNETNNIISPKNEDNNQVSENNKNTQSEINEWNLKLVNYENSLPSDFIPQLSSIDNTRKFDTRAIGKLNELIADMKKDGISDIWVQSSYRSIEQQQTVYNKKINEYIRKGKTPKEAEKLTLKVINKPGTSEHNLGLAVDFNYVNLEFEKTKAFKWLKENAENYGFILRYQKEKEGITKVNYEPWHWRYVGEEHAKKMNGLDLCLEEYIEYLK